MTAPAAHLMTFQEWADMVHNPTKDKAYQQVTRLGGSVGRYLAWKRPEAAGRSLDIYEFYLAALCLHLAQNHGDPAEELSLGIPPAYTELIGHQLIQHIQRVAA